MTQCAHWFTIQAPEGERAFHASALKAMDCPWCIIARLQHQSDRYAEGMRKLVEGEPVAVPAEKPAADRVAEALQIIHAAGYRIAGPVLSPAAYAQYVDDNTPYLVKVAQAYPDGPIAKMLGMDKPAT